MNLYAYILKFHPTFKSTENQSKAVLSIFKNYKVEGVPGENAHHRYPGTKNPVSGHSIYALDHSEADSEKGRLELKPASCSREMGCQDGAETVMQRCKGELHHPRGGRCQLTV